MPTAISRVNLEQPVPKRLQRQQLFLELQSLRVFSLESFLSLL